MWKRYKDTFYEVSIDGRVRTIEHIVTKSDGTTYTCVPKELKPATDKKGYKRAGLSIDGKLVTRKVHRLVAECYISNFNDKPQVNHIDGNKANNYITNLEWVTNRENQIHAIETGLIKQRKREPKAINKKIKFSDEFLINAYKEYLSGTISKRGLARKYGFERSIFRRACIHEINS